MKSKLKIDELIKNGDTLFISSGTTSLVVAKRLKSSKRNLNIVTNSFEVAADSSKIGRNGFSFVCTINDKISVITNS